MTELRVVHVLRWFEKTSEWLVGEELLRHVTAEELRQLFELAADDPVYNVYPIGEREAEWLGTRVCHVFDRDAYFYVIEAQQRGAEIAQQRGAEIAQQRGAEIAQQRGAEIAQQRGAEIAQQREGEIAQQREGEIAQQREADGES